MAIIKIDNKLMSAKEIVKKLDWLKYISLINENLNIGLNYK